jgi:hypothetical protein
MKCKFKVGDKVIGNDKANRRYVITKKGWVGVVTKVEAGYFVAKDIHNNKEYTLGYNYFDLFSSEKIVITTDGKTTTAKLYDGNKFIKSAEAKCSPEDTFNFKVGAEIAFNRLISKPCGEEAPKSTMKYPDGKYICIKHKRNKPDFTIGKVYEQKNRKITGDTDFTYGPGFKSSAIEWLEPYYEFIPFVED